MAGFVILRRDLRRNLAMNVGYDGPRRSLDMKFASYQHQSAPVKVVNPYSGPYALAGQTVVLSQPVARRVDLIDAASGTLVRRVFTKADGYFEFRHISEGPWVVLGMDPANEQNDVVFANIRAKIF